MKLSQKLLALGGVALADYACCPYDDYGMPHEACTNELPEKTPFSLADDWNHGACKAWESNVDATYDGNDNGCNNNENWGSCGFQRHFPWNALDTTALRNRGCIVTDGDATNASVPDDADEDFDTLSDGCTCKGLGDANADQNNMVLCRRMNVAWEFGRNPDTDAVEHMRKEDGILSDGSNCCVPADEITCNGDEADHESCAAAILANSGIIPTTIAEVTCLGECTGLNVLDESHPCSDGPLNAGDNFQLPLCCDPTADADTLGDFTTAGSCWVTCDADHTLAMDGLADCYANDLLGNRNLQGQTLWLDYDVDGTDMSYDGTNTGELNFSNNSQPSSINAPLYNLGGVPFLGGVCKLFVPVPMERIVSVQIAGVHVSLTGQSVFPAMVGTESSLDYAGQTGTAYCFSVVNPAEANNNDNGIHNGNVAGGSAAFNSDLGDYANPIFDQFNGDPFMDMTSLNRQAGLEPLVQYYDGSNNMGTQLRDYSPSNDAEPDLEAAGDSEVGANFDVVVHIHSTWCNSPSFWNIADMQLANDYNNGVLDYPLNHELSPGMDVSPNVPRLYNPDCKVIPGDGEAACACNDEFDNMPNKCNGCDESGVCTGTCNDAENLIIASLEACEDAYLLTGRVDNNLHADKAAAEAAETAAAEALDEAQAAWATSGLPKDAGGIDDITVGDIATDWISYEDNTANIDAINCYYYITDPVCQNNVVAASGAYATLQACMSSADFVDIATSCASEDASYTAAIALLYTYSTVTVDDVERVSAFTGGCMITANPQLAACEYNGIDGGTGLPETDTTFDGDVTDTDAVDAHNLACANVFVGSDIWNLSVLYTQAYRDCVDDFEDDNLCDPLLSDGAGGVVSCEDQLVTHTAACLDSHPAEQYEMNQCAEASSYIGSSVADMQANSHQWPDTLMAAMWTAADASGDANAASALATANLANFLNNDFTHAHTDLMDKRHNMEATFNTVYQADPDNAGYLRYPHGDDDRFKTTDGQVWDSGVTGATQYIRWPNAGAFAAFYSFVACANPPNWEGVTFDGATEAIAEYVNPYAFIYPERGNGDDISEANTALGALGNPEANDPIADMVGDAILADRTVVLSMTDSDYRDENCTGRKFRGNVRQVGYDVTNCGPGQLPDTDSKRCTWNWNYNAASTNNANANGPASYTQQVTFENDAEEWFDRNNPHNFDTWSTRKRRGVALGRKDGFNSGYWGVQDGVQGGWADPATLFDANAEHHGVDNGDAISVPITNYNFNLIFKNADGDHVEPTVSQNTAQCFMPGADIYDDLDTFIQGDQPNADPCVCAPEWTELVNLGFETLGQPADPAADGLTEHQLAYNLMATTELTLASPLAGVHLYHDNCNGVQDGIMHQLDAAIEACENDDNCCLAYYTLESDGVTKVAKEGIVDGTGAAAIVDNCCADNSLYTDDNTSQPLPDNTDSDAGGIGALCYQFEDSGPNMADQTNDLSATKKKCNDEDLAYINAAFALPQACEAFKADSSRGFFQSEPADSQSMDFDDDRISALYDPQSKAWEVTVACSQRREMANIGEHQSQRDFFPDCFFGDEIHFTLNYGTTGVGNVGTHLSAVSAWQTSGNTDTPTMIAPAE